MKKRLPTLVVFGGTLIVGLFIMLWPSLFPPQIEKDSDRDGFIDKIDKCDNDSSKTNNGCPEEVAKNGDDLDGDGYFGGFQKDTLRKDRDDSDPCIPNEQCKLCDLDKDGLNVEQESQKGSDPKNPDSDGDGVKDGVDKCVDQYGLLENYGCKLIIDAGVKKKGNNISWNTDLEIYSSDLQLVVYDKSSGNQIFRGNVYGGSKKLGKLLRLGFPYKIQLIAIPSDSKAISFKNTTLE